MKLASLQLKANLVKPQGQDMRLVSLHTVKLKAKLVKPQGQACKLLNEAS